MLVDIQINIANICRENKSREEEQSFLEKDLTINELREALTSFADNKPPGEDGFTKEFLIFSARTLLILIMTLSAKVHCLHPRNEEQ